ncbi:MAG: T9SS type A sorting domain-containing protein [Bacteroidales bacterium]|nr:T9SS type A sorting domain-containing protein [Bacteroidales bacterium]
MRVIIIFIVLMLSCSLMSQDKHIILEIDQTGINDCITNIENTFLETEVKVYPNPNRGMFSIEVDGNINELNLKVIEISGATVLDQQLFFNKENRIQEINLSDRKGVYLLIIYNEKAHYVSKIIIE